MAQFFLSWQLWEQMTFALACAMVLVVCAAFVRNAWDWWNLRKHVRVLKEQQAEQARLLEIHPSIRKRQLKGQVPFGVRAIQSGIEVEGVWISRPNSTFNSPSNTSPASPAALEPQRSLGDKLAAAKARKTDDPLNSVAGAARQLEMQTVGGRTIPPRAARDPFRDSMAASEREGKSEKSETASQRTRKHRADSSTYHSMPDEEAGYLPSGYASSKMPASTRSSQAYPAEQNYPAADYFTLPAHQPQAYVPTRRTDYRSSTHNTYVPTDASPHDPNHSRTGSSYGYNYPQGYSQPYSQTDSQTETPVELDIGEGLGAETRLTAQRPRHLQADPDRRDNRNSSYHLVFSNNAGTNPQTQASSRRESVADPFATPLSVTSTQPPTRTIQTRADAEAEASNMRRVNEGFSVARHGQRRDEESLAVAARDAQAQTAPTEAGKEGDRKERKKLQKKDRRSGSAEERKASQFKENI